MKIIFVSLLCLILIGITSYSYAQYTFVYSNTKIPEVVLQLELRDSDGVLLTYIESKTVVAIDQLLFDKYLDNQYKEFFIRDGKAYEKIQVQGMTEKFDKKHAYSLFILWTYDQNEFKQVLAMAHNSYQTQPDDILRVFWTIVRPAN